MCLNSPRDLILLFNFCADDFFLFVVVVVAVVVFDVNPPIPLDFQVIAIWTSPIPRRLWNRDRLAETPRWVSPANWTTPSRPSTTASYSVASPMARGCRWTILARLLPNWTSSVSFSFSFLFQLTKSSLFWVELTVSPIWFFCFFKPFYSSSSAQRWDDSLRFRARPARWHHRQLYRQPPPVQRRLEARQWDRVGCWTLYRSFQRSSCRSLWA